MRQATALLTSEDKVVLAHRRSLDSPLLFGRERRLAEDRCLERCGAGVESSRFHGRQVNVHRDIQSSEFRAPHDLSATCVSMENAELGSVRELEVCGGARVAIEARRRWWKADDLGLDLSAGGFQNRLGGRGIPLGRRRKARIEIGFAFR